MNITSIFKEICYTFLKKHTLLNDTMIVKACAKTPFAEQRVICAIYNSGNIKNVTIMNREANDVYTLCVESCTLTTPRVLQKKIIKALKDDAAMGRTKEPITHSAKIMDCIPNALLRQINLL